MNIPDALRFNVQNLERQIATQKNTASELVSSKSKVSAQYRYACSQMGWREKYLAGWFWGDKSLVRKANNLEQDAQKYEKSIALANARAESIDKKVHTSITDYLIKTDPVYKQLQDVYDHVTKVKDAAESYMGTIDSALSEVDDAQGMETLDLVSNNKAFSVLSYAENSEAQDAIDTVKERTSVFQRSLQKYNGFLKEHPVSEIENVHIGDGLDLAFDFVFDGFDFMSIVTLSNLNGAESALDDLRSKVLSAQDKINQHYTKAESNVMNYVNSVRQDCR